MMVTGTLAEKGFHAFDGEPKSHAGTKILHTWVVVADKEQAHIYRRTEKGLEEIAHATAKGAQIKSVDDHVFEPQSLAPPHKPDTHHEKSSPAELAFIRRLVEWLDVAEKEKAFDRIVLAAAPHTLGDIRGFLPKNIQDRVHAELNKDLIKLPLRELQAHLDKIM